MEPFKLERYFAAREFSCPLSLSYSDCEPVRMDNIVRRADADLRRQYYDLTLGYTDSQGDAALRETIALTYREVGPEQVLVAAPEECIYIAMRSLLRRGDHVIVTYPGYQSLHAVAEDQGCEVTRWMPVQKSGDLNWYFDPEFLHRAIRTSTRMLIVNFPHNPTGALPLHTDLAHMVHFARSHRLILFSDEMYRGLEHHPSHRLDAACDLYENALSLAGMSKAYGMAGLRIGWMATQNPRLLEACAGYKDWTTICSSPVDQTLALMALQNAEYFLDRSRTIIAENLVHARQFFEEEYGYIFQWLPPQAGSVCFPFFTDGVPVARLAPDLESRKQVTLVPGDLFDYPGNHFRVGLGRKNFPKALNKFREYLHEYDYIKIA